MPSLTIVWEYLTGYAVATDPTSRERAEWPPHPGRVFMALAAAWFETEPFVGDGDARQAWDSEGDSLRWLETLGDPELRLPLRDHVSERSAVTAFVPVNDKAGPAAATLQSAPALTRSKQPRTFPRMWVGYEPCSMYWPAAEGVDKHRAALDRLCGKVTRIGHSSSLVHMWVANEDQAACESTHERWVMCDGLADIHVRNVSCGTLDRLAELFNKPARERHAKLMGQIEALQEHRKMAKGKRSNERKAAIDEEVASLREQVRGINPRPPVRPSLGLWSGYRPEEHAAPIEVRRTQFDTDVLVLTQVDGPRLPVVSTLAVTRMLRKTIMRESAVQPVPPWVSGHEPSGEPLRSDDDGHLAIIPLPFVGGAHADGHLLGAGLVFPRPESPEDRRKRGKVLGKLLLYDTGLPKAVELKLGPLGVWKVQKRDWSETRQALSPETWTGHPSGTDTWASVTPVVLDKFPKPDRITDRPAWTRAVAKIISAACVRIGLPDPLDIDIDTTSWHLESPRATQKRRTLRGHADHSRDADAAFGDGFPPFPARGTNASRPQVHVWLRFAEPVVGPILLGAGRYLGYGLCKPLKESRR